MRPNPTAIILIVLGAVLLAFGFFASDSIASSFSRLFTGKPTDKVIFLIIGGVVALGTGLVLTMRPNRT